MSIKQLINKTFAVHSELPLLVNDKEVPMIVGVETAGGFYKNGYKCSKIDGLKGKHKYYKLFIYTSASREVDIEEKWLIRIEENGEYTIKSHRGWNNVDLMKFGDNEEDLLGHLKYFYKRLVLGKGPRVWDIGICEDEEPSEQKYEDMEIELGGPVIYCGGGRWKLG